MVSPGALKSTAQDIFASIAHSYERWSRLLSLGQDPRWRAKMVGRLAVTEGGRVLDVAAGTGLVTRLLEARGARVIALDQSAAMLRQARVRGATAVLAAAELLPFADATFDALSLTYLLRYLDDPAAGMRELVRVLRPGGTIGMVEFGRPRGMWRPLWVVYTRLLLPAAGALAGPEWRKTGSFLGPSIDALYRRYPGEGLTGLWREAGLVAIEVERPSLGGGLVMWARKP